MSAENFEQNYLSMNPKNVGAEINQLQRTLELIVQPYQRPIASILPEERRLEISLLFDDTDIEDCYDRFSSWEGSLSKQKVRDWLNQFETNLDKNIAYLLISKFQFFSKNDIEAATQNLQSKLINFLLDKEHLREAFYSDPKAPIKNEAELQKWLRNKVIRYARLPSPPNTSVESQDRLWGTYERSALTGTSAPDGKKLRPLKEYFESTSGNPETSVFVFMDYTNGSGNQLGKCIKQINKLIQDYPIWQDSIFIFMYIVQSESFSLGTIESVPANSQTLFSDKMLYYKDPEIRELMAANQITEAEYDAFIEKYCLRSSGKPAVGYRQSGSLTCHHYSCPNNTLPFFHKPAKNWTPLFRNSQTPSATSYKRK
jgi:hypothetical protein